MAINKIQYGNTTLIDLTADTVTAGTLISGTTAHDRTGAVITGTAPSDGYVWQDENGYVHLSDEGSGSGGGGGLEYETGTFTTNAAIARPTISFSKTHDTPPALVVMNDTTSPSTAPTNNSNTSFVYCDFHLLNESGFPAAQNVSRYGLVTYGYYASSLTSVGVTQITYNSDNPDSSSTAYSRYWADEQGFRPYSNSTSRYWRADRNYKWTAIWAAKS